MKHIFDKKTMILAVLGLMGMIISLVVYKEPKCVFYYKIKQNEKLIVNHTDHYYSLPLMDICSWDNEDTRKSTYTKIELKCYDTYFTVETRNCLNEYRKDLYYSAQNNFYIRIENRG